jgi:hypothetical protein
VIQNSPSNRHLIIYLLLLFSSLYLLTASRLNVNIGDVAIMKLEVARSIVERSEVSVTVPAELGMLAHDGKQYSVFGFGGVAVILPFFIAGKLTGIPPESLVTLVNQFAGAATGVVVFLFCQSLGYRRRASVYVSICYGLGTFAWHYAKEPGDHAIEALFCLLAVYFTQRHVADNGRNYLFLAALSLGLAFLTRTTSALVGAALVVLIALPHRLGARDNPSISARAIDVLRFISLLLPFLAVFFWYNYARFGSIFETGYTLMASRLGLDFFTGTALATGLTGFLISPSKGFFYYSPIALLFFFALRPFCRRKPEVALTFIIIIVSYLLFLSRNVYWHGDWAWGPRYLFVITPYLIIPLVEVFDSPRWEKSPVVRKAVYALFTVSVVIQLMSVSLHIYNYFYYLNAEKVPFTTVRATGAPEICEPTMETYFNPRYAPIPIQAKLILSKGSNLMASAPNSHTQPGERRGKNKQEPWRDGFDFWWLYSYYLDGSMTGFVAAFILSIISLWSTIKLRQAIA